MSSTIERDYLRSLRDVLEYGEEKHPERKLEAGRKLSHYTKGISCLQLTHNMTDGFPLFTTRKLWFKNTAVELEGFIKGITDKKWFKERGCPYWNEWANPVLVKKRVDELEKEHDRKAIEYHGPEYDFWNKQAKLEENDLGPIYGYQWRNFGGQYGSIKTTEMNPDYPNQWVRHPNGINHGFDQLQNIIDTLKTHPNDRRMVCSAWNPNQFDISALAPCHITWGISHWNGKLDLWWVQRSVDMYAGFPANISSYALLLLLICKETGFTPNKLVFWGVDCHLYSNQFENVKIQLEREPLPLPRVKITGDKSIFEWTHKDFELTDYQFHPALEKIDVVV